MPGPMRKLAAVQFCTWFALFCLWIYFAPGVAKGIFHGAPLGVANAAVDRTLDEPENAPVLDPAAAVARGYEDAEGAARGGRPGGRGAGPGRSTRVKTMLGLKPPGPDPGRADRRGRDRGRRRARARRRRVPRRPRTASAANPMVRTIASLLGQHGLAAGSGRARRSSRPPRRARRAARLRAPLPGGRRVGRRLLRDVQPRGLRASRSCCSALVRRLSARTIHIACLVLGRPRASSRCSRSATPNALLLVDGRGRRRVGEHPRDAVRDALERPAAGEDGLLHGRLQLLHRAAADPGLGGPRLRDASTSSATTPPGRCCSAESRCSSPRRSRCACARRRRSRALSRPVAAFSARPCSRAPLSPWCLCRRRTGASRAAIVQVTKVEPPSWWPGHSIDPVRLLVRGANLAGRRVTRPATGLKAGPLKVNDAGTLPLRRRDDRPAGRRRARGRSPSARPAAPPPIPFELLAPLPREGRFQGFSPDDAIYLVMPDRFANGDPSNDDPAVSKGLLDRTKARYYHGGDLRGVIRPPAVPEGPRRHRDLAQPLVRQRQPPERARDLRRPGDHRLPRLRRRRLLRGRRAPRRPRRRCASWSTRRTRWGSR